MLLLEHLSSKDFINLSHHSTKFLIHLPQDKVPKQAEIVPKLVNLKYFIVDRLEYNMKQYS